MSQKLLSLLLIIITICPLGQATTLKGTVYNAQLNPEQDVLMEINTVPVQKYLAKEGSYTFDLPPGSYTLTAKKTPLETAEKIEIIAEGIYIYDVFLTPNLAEEDELWNETNENYLQSTETLIEEKTPFWSYLILGIISLYAIYRIYQARKKYGPLNLFRKRIKQESQKTTEQIKQELSQQPDHLDKTLSIIKQHQGRITQKELRKEMLYLSEAKVSLIITELEHKQKITKIKKGRGNIIILKSS